MNQNVAPLFEALRRYIDDKVVPFHVPGHKHGRGMPELRDFLGERVFQLDVNGMRDLDYLNNPTGVIMDAQDLFAEAFGANRAHLLVNGTTCGVQAMIMSTCEPGSEIILPRNAHRSTIGGIILSGALPVYVQPEIHRELGITMGITTEKLSRTIDEHPHARAVFLINPTYYGITSDIESVVNLAHDHTMPVLVDEAHGAHMYFHEDFPLTAMAAGADMCAASVHKTAGSFTQSSILLENSAFISPDKVKQVLNLTSTSSASYLLMCSLDVARKQLATRGTELLDRTLKLVRAARKRINAIEGLHAFGPELTGLPGCLGFDETKLAINVRRLGYTGYQTETLLREKYNVQIELADLYNILAIVSIGDREEDLQMLVTALQDMAGKADKRDLKNSTAIPSCPEMIVSPRDAFYSPKKTLPLEKCAGQIAGEMIMAYPPGIPVVCMGERITQDMVDYILILKEEACELQGTADPDVAFIRVLGRN